MQHEDELAIVLGHEIAHAALKQCAQRVIASMQRNHLTADQFDQLAIEDFGKPYGKEGELAADHEGVNDHLNSEYLAVLETDHSTPYYVNLHDQDVAHTLILGYTGSGKSFLLNFLIQNLQKYEPLTYIFDLGGSYESLTQIFGGSYLNVGLESQAFTINPFCLESNRENLNFLYVFAKVLGTLRI
jgi:hypothetical protein